MILEVAIPSLVALAIGVFWIHRKYPKPQPPEKIPFDLEKHLQRITEIEEKIKALWVGYTGNMMSPWQGGPNG